MAVPSVVQQRIQREEQALREQGIDPNGPPSGAPAAVSPPTPTFTPTVPAAPAPSGTDEAAALRTKVAELEAELRTQSGRTSSSATETKELKDRLELIDTNRRFLETTLTEIQERNNTLESQLADAVSKGTSTQLHAAVSALDEGGPTEAQLKQYDSDTVDFVQRVVRQQLAAVIKPLVADIAEIKKSVGQVKEINNRLPPLEESVKVSNINNQRLKEEQFLRAEVLPHFSDFETVRTTQEWKDYLSKDTGRGYPIGVLLKTYRQQNDAVNIRGVIGAFYEQRKAKPSLDALAVPGKSTADAPETPAPVKMKASEYKEKLRQLTSKRISKPDWEAYRARWEQALNTGNVEMDVELR